MPAPLANALWLASCLPAAARFARGTRQVLHVQEQVLAALIGRNARSAFGAEHGFARISDVRGFRERVPLRDYEALQPWLIRVAQGEENVLSCERVSLLEPTSGSTGAGKLIPFTPALRSEFGAAIAPWIADLFAHDPRLMRGTAYWSLSPLADGASRTEGGVPIGFEEDAEYFGAWQRRLIRATQAVPGEVRLVSDAAAFRYVTLLFLLRARDLSLVSVWNPTFFLLLAQSLAKWWPLLARDIRCGTISTPGLPDDLRRTFEPWNRPDPQRAREIRAAFRSIRAPVVHARLWPRLRLISCWADAHAAREAAELARLFPHAQLQPKGVIATEGVVSFPLANRVGAALAICSHFFEFLPARWENHEWRVDEGKEPFGAHELQAGRMYEVVLSTGGGLWRYRLGDVVEVVGFKHQCPLLRFASRLGGVCDRRGEKLHPEHARRALQQVLERRRVHAEFAMLAPEDSENPMAGEPLFYALFVESGAPDGELRALGTEVEYLLRENFHFALCRRLGQVGALRVRRVEGGHGKYLRACVERGQRAGDVKSAALDASSGWAQVLGGRWL